MEGRNPSTHSLLEQARVELADLEERAGALRVLLDRAAQAEAAQLEGSEDATRASQARSMASHMALEGHTRASAEDGLRTLVGRRACKEILDQVYGPQAQAS